VAKPIILLQLDADPQPSAFDAIVAADCGVDHLLRHHSVTPDTARDLVHGAMFTRGPEDLRHTAIFIGGSDVAAGESLLAAVRECYFGPVRVSVMLDANGANTTAAAAVLSAARHVELDGATVLLLAATGPVGLRAARLLARQGARVRLASRNAHRAEAACDAVRRQIEGARLSAHQTATEDETAAALDGAGIVIAAGAAGVQLLTVQTREQCASLQVAIDLNAVPPAGLAGVEATDKAAARGGAVCYGAIGVGGLKMKIHKAALARLFETNDQVLDAEEIYAIGQALSK